MKRFWDIVPTSLVVIALVAFVGIISYNAHKSITRQLAGTPSLEQRMQEAEKRIDTLEYQVAKNAEHVHAVLSNAMVLACIVSNQQVMMSQMVSICSNAISFGEIQVLDMPVWKKVNYGITTDW